MKNKQYHTKDGKIIQEVTDGGSGIARNYPASANITGLVLYLQCLTCAAYRRYGISETLKVLKRGEIDSFVVETACEHCGAKIGAQIKNLK